MRRRNFAAVALMGIFAAFPARAELPAEVTERDYQNCVGDGTDADRAAYCACVRDEMQKWDDQTYMQMVLQTAAANIKGDSQPPALLDALAKQCLAKVRR